ncbi:UDP-N-acetylmuramoyl-tripeptide--D-alanyl-D-alanine ligase [Rubeoparvulum massiliense]|uniref:UDP-N-acetylmuramoyl-tripeptide--D-alanyl-D- alanine ligase n=1 Tax=Rubeoparvulum massiliense TaxID=1631346 RepID=UPI00065E8090|nr:UDP-N-acetylmuramoyl-tripeptide--D-alanyl-D-alanine ligase [Rubeoparvulum massiliense]
MLQLEWLQQALAATMNLHVLQAGTNKEWNGVQFDSRLVEPGNLFIPLTSGTRDGHVFIPNALQNGAHAIILSDSTYLQTIPPSCTVFLIDDTEKALQALAAAYRQLLSTRIIAVTGSNGKTTTKDMTAHLLRSCFKTYSTYKNLNNHLGVPLSLLQIAEDDEMAVIEMGMNHAGELDFLGQLVQPNYSIITNVNDAHIEFFGTREKIAEAKAELITHTDPKGCLLLNGDDPLVRAMSSRYAGQVYLYGISSDDTDIQATAIHADADGTHFQVRIGEQISFPCQIPLYGKHNVSNLLPGLLLAHLLGASIEALQEQARTLQISGMRFERIIGKNEALLINDAYNASPTSMRAAIDTFASILPEKKKVLVIGDMFELGEDSAQLHAGLGDYVNSYASQLSCVFTLGESMEHFHHHYEGRKQHCTTHQELAEALQPYLLPNYALLFKASRGMTLEKVIEALLPVKA